jgi:hypothetical protein
MSDSKICKRSSKKVVSTKMKEGLKVAFDTAAVVPPHTVDGRDEFNETFAPSRRLVFSRFQERDLIHVREFACMSEKEYPTKKGVCLTPSRLKALMTRIAEIDEALRQREVNEEYGIDGVLELYKAHLGGAIYVTVSSAWNGLDLRRHWCPEGQTTIVPTKNGIYLPTKQWSALKEKLNELLIAKPELALAEECFHQNQMGMINCRECLPFRMDYEGL